MSNETGLRYIGEGTSVEDVPTRNLNRTEVRKYGKQYLLDTGLYVEVFLKPAIKNKFALKSGKGKE